MTDDVKSILERFERQQQTRFMAIAEMLNQTIEMMAMDRQRLYQEVAKQYSVTGEQLKKSTELFDELSKKYDDLSAKYAEQIKVNQELLEKTRIEEENFLGPMTMQPEG